MLPTVARTISGNLEVIMMSSRKVLAVTQYRSSKEDVTMAKLHVKHLNKVTSRMGRASEKGGLDPDWVEDTNASCT